MAYRLDIYQQDQTMRAKGSTDLDWPMRLRMEQYVKDLQQRIVKAMEQIDGPFEQHHWERPNQGGEGWTCVLQDGHVMEKAGVAVSVVYSELSSAAAVQMRPRYGDQFTEDLAGKPFFVTGISLVMHGKNPHVPTVHMNYRYFEVFDDQGQPLVWWFGGGADLTPCYLYEDDAIHFHQLHKDGCDAIDGSGALYDQCKLACDTYFYNSHRQEARGIGGVFYDNLHHLAPDCLFDLTQALGDRFLPAYLPILTRRKDTYFTADEVHWQQIRRGRYVEFNLLHDRGTKFGLQTPCAQIEAIFMTMPLLARWEYNYYPHHASPEAAMEHVLKKPRDWLGLEQEKSVSK